MFGKGEEGKIVPRERERRRTPKQRRGGLLRKRWKRECHERDRRDLCYGERRRMVCERGRKRVPREKEGSPREREREGGGRRILRKRGKKTVQERESSSQSGSQGFDCGELVKCDKSGVVKFESDLKLNSDFPLWIQLKLGSKLIKPEYPSSGLAKF